MSQQLPVKPENSFFQLPDYIAIGNSNYLPIVLEGGTTSHLPHIQWQENTGESGSFITEGRYASPVFFNNNRQFIHLEESFEKQLHQFEYVFQDQNIYSLNEKMRLSTEAILNYFPDKVSLELTNEGSIFYTFLKNDFIVYFQHFLIDEFDGNDEVLISIFKGAKSIINFAGSFVEGINELNKSLFSELSSIHEIA